MFNKKIKSGEQIYPEMISIIIDEMVIEGVKYYSVSYLLYIDKDLANSRVIEIGTTLNSDVSFIDAVNLAIDYAERIWSLEVIYPSAFFRNSIGVQGHAVIVDILKDYQKQLYNKEETV